KAPGFRDKEATKARAREIETEVDRRKAGMAQAVAHKPFVDAKEAYLDELVRRGSEQNGCHVKETRRILDTLEKHWGWKKLQEIRADPPTEYLAATRTAGSATRTQNRYPKTLRPFLNFCTSQRWLHETPIAHLKRAPQGQAHRRHRRRAY